MSLLNKSLIISAFAILTMGTLHAQENDSIVYKQVGADALYLHVDYPKQFDPSLSYPAMVFFFGGGWKGGTVEQFAPHATYFASLGMVCFRADYRVQNRQGTSPFESLKDAKSALRYIRKHAPELGVDPDRIVASGGSAGGHLAAATAVIDGFNEAGEDLSISCIPNALVLFNPVFDNGPGGYAYERIGEEYKDFSPLHNLKKGMPPAIVFLGTQDKLIPVETARYFRTVMEKVGSRSDLFLYEGEGHGFFNYRNYELYVDTRDKAAEFLISTGIILHPEKNSQGEPAE
jgi:acetyl esterase/lipase